MELSIVNLIPVDTLNFPVSEEEDEDFSSAYNSKWLICPWFVCFHNHFVSVIMFWYDSMSSKSKTISHLCEKQYAHYMPLKGLILPDELYHILTKGNTYFPVIVSSKKVIGYH